MNFSQKLLCSLIVITLGSAPVMAKKGLQEKNISFKNQIDPKDSIDDDDDIDDDIDNENQDESGINKIDVAIITTAGLVLAGATYFGIKKYYDTKTTTAELDNATKAELENASDMTVPYLFVGTGFMGYILYFLSKTGIIGSLLTGGSNKKNVEEVVKKVVEKVVEEVVKKVEKKVENPVEIDTKK